ncbi:hypothetical protein AMELA_G00245000 [Ameiurus melas]|uniref:Uncharacterized protein n=1 Tax=Ameiurus melas TaxID=219545 RepID=A0A7J5ZSE9_AMEME|nr:hypothetical protein AMELA_G00245000 [Ameiurus melas]
MIIFAVLDMMSLKGTTTGKDIFEAVSETVEKMGLKLDKICGGTTVGAPAMTGPVQTQLPAVDDSLLDQGLMSEVVGVSVTQTDSAVPQVLTKPQSLPSARLHLMTLRKSLRYGHFGDSSRS